MKQFPKNDLYITFPLPQMEMINQDMSEVVVVIIIEMMARSNLKSVNICRL